VMGTRACKQLAVYLHCRNCPVYLDAAAQLLDRPVPEDYRQEWKTRVSLEKRVRDRSSSSAVLFRIGSEWLALPTHCMLEAAERRLIHSLPHQRNALVLGIANVRGEFLLCVSLGHLLGLPHLPDPRELRVGYERLMVIGWESCKAGFPVDEVQGPHRFYPEDCTSPLATTGRFQPAFTESLIQWRQRAVGLLDPDLLCASLKRGFA
jgi:chemotaxis-related protein WspD